MAIHPISLLDATRDAASKKPAVPVVLPPRVKDDVALNAILEAPIPKHLHRNPLEWAGATVLHIALLAALIIIPLYTTGTIRLNYEAIPLVAPPPPAPPPAPVAGAVAPHAVHPKAKLTYKIQKLTPPTAIPRKVSAGSEEIAEAAPDVGGLAGGIPGGIAGGQVGGAAIGGIAGGRGPAPPPPPPKPRTTPKIVRVGSNLKAPRQTLNVNPEYPPLARNAHIWGTVLVDAIIDERGNVVQARALSGHPLLIGPALKAVLQWKYEPTSLNGQPISVELEVQVHFNIKEE